MAGTCRLRLEGDIRGLKKRIRQFSEMDKKRLNRVLSSVVRTSTLERFKRSRTPEGKRWQPSRRAQTEAGKTLIQSGILKNSIRKASNDSGFAVGTNNIYAATHQFGDPGRRITIRAKTSRGLIFKIGDQWIRKKQVTIRVRIPARPFLGLSEDDMAEIKGTVEDFFEDT